MTSQSYQKRSLCFSVFSMVASGITWCVFKSKRQDNNNILPTTRSCGDICGFDYYFPSGSYSCCDFNSYNCRTKYDCQRDLDATYYSIQTAMTIIFIVFVVWSIILGCLILQRRKRQRAPRAPNQLYNIYERNHNHLYDNGDPSILNRSEQKKSNGINQVLRDSFSVRDSQNICPVCFEAYEDSKSLMLKCGHLFHSKCIRDWAQKKNNCPICREDV